MAPKYWTRAFDAEKGGEVYEEGQIDREQNRQADRQNFVIYMLLKVYIIYNEFKTFYLKFTGISSKVPNNS